jgi:hypothetical protein
VGSMEQGLPGHPAAAGALDTCACLHPTVHRSSAPHVHPLLLAQWLFDWMADEFGAAKVRGWGRAGGAHRQAGLHRDGRAATPRLPGPWATLAAQAPAQSSHGPLTPPAYKTNHTPLLLSTLPPLVQINGNNGAIAGTLSAYMSVCHNLHIPRRGPPTVGRRCSRAEERAVGGGTRCRHAAPALPACCTRAPCQ